jgi:hypothetical protein
MYISYVADHEAGTYKRCLRCQTIHEHLRERCRTANQKLRGYGELWPAERLDCGEAYEDEWDGPPPDDIARLAFLTTEEVQALPLASRPKQEQP